jgi:flagellar hook-basal body complex protein FliE
MMDLLSSLSAQGGQIEQLRTDPRHFDVNGKMGPIAGAGKETFQDALMSAMEGVNADQIKASDLYTRMITNPDSVDAHDVTLAGAQAQMSLNLAKNVVERGLQAYRDIINMR